MQEFLSASAEKCWERAHLRKGWGVCWRMRVRVLLFGVLTERLRGKERVVELAEQATVADVIAWARNLEMEDGLLRSLAVAVNREYAQLETRLSEGDEIALLPPVSGGCRRRTV